MISLASWNVNGIRACREKGFLGWLSAKNYDIVCLQETKAWPDQLEAEILTPKGYFSHFSSAEKKGYSGVCFFIKNKFKDKVKVTDGMGIAKFDSEGRTIILEHDDFILYNCYFPNGQDSLARVPYKMEFCREIAKHALKMKKKMGKEVLICGDYNTAHKEIDLRNPKANMKCTGFLPEERAWIDDFIDMGFRDVFRDHHPNEPDHYTWWSYRSAARPKNVGWRIDYFFVTEGLATKVKEIFHEPETMGSDHCPVVIKI